LGSEISSFEPIRPGWADLVPEVPIISIVGHFDGCITENPKISIEGRKIVNRDPDTCDECTYELLARVPKESCQGLAPHIEENCEGANLVRVTEWYGGSMGSIAHYNIYAYYNLESGKKIIAPLKNFGHLKDALEFIDLLNNQ